MNVFTASLYSSTLSSVPFCINVSLLATRKAMRPGLSLWLELMVASRSKHEVKRWGLEELICTVCMGSRHLQVVGVLVSLQYFS